MVCKFLVIFGKNNVSLYDSFCAVERELTVDITLYWFSLIRVVHYIGILLLEVNILLYEIILFLGCIFQWLALVSVVKNSYNSSDYYYYYCCYYYYYIVFHYCTFDRVSSHFVCVLDILRHLCVICSFTAVLVFGCMWPCLVATVRINHMYWIGLLLLILDLPPF
jgi:hypothetical protein